MNRSGICIRHNREYQFVETATGTHYRKAGVYHIYNPPQWFYESGGLPDGTVIVSLNK